MPSGPTTRSGPGRSLNRIASTPTHPLVRFICRRARGQPCAASSPARCVTSRCRAARRAGQSAARCASQTARNSSAARAPCPRPVSRSSRRPAQACSCAVRSPAAATSSGTRATSASSDSSVVSIPPPGGSVRWSGRYLVAAINSTSPRAYPSPANRSRNAARCRSRQGPAHGSPYGRANWTIAASVSANGDSAKRDRDSASESSRSTTTAPPSLRRPLGGTETIGPPPRPFAHSAGASTTPSPARAPPVPPGGHEYQISSPCR